MKNTLVASTLVAALVGVTASAQAQQQDPSDTYVTTGRAESGDYFTQRVPAPRRAFELTVGTGYTQGFGSFERGVGMPSVVTPGLAVDVGGAYRIDPHWAIGVTGQYQELKAERASSARGLTPGLGVAYHIAPYVRSDPWVQLGVGYRMLWENLDAPVSTTVLSHGVELAKLTAGFDMRFSKDIAVAPVIGADLNMFLWRRGGGDSVAIADPRLNTFVFAGAQGRFDIGGTREGGATATTARR